MKKLSCLLLMLVCLVAMPLGAQTTNQVIKSWNLLTFSDETVKNLEADTEHWEYDSKKGRYANTQPNDGEELKANGVVIKETAGLFIGAGMEAGTLRLPLCEMTEKNLAVLRASMERMGLLK